MYASILKTSEASKKAWLSRQRKTQEGPSIPKGYESVWPKLSEKTQASLREELDAWAEVQSADKVSYEGSASIAGAKFYHGTTSTAVASILKNGLLPNGGEGADAFAKKHNLLIHQEGATDTAHVFVTDNRDKAERYARMAARAKGASRPVVLELSVPDTISKQFEQDPRDRGGDRSKLGIPASAISSVKEVRLSPPPTPAEMEHHVAYEAKQAEKKANRKAKALAHKGDLSQVYAVLLLAPSKKSDYAGILKTSEASTKAWLTRRGGASQLDGLGILRKDMPQIKSADMAEFMHFAAENKVDIMRGKTTVGDLKPSQDEYNAKQAEQMPEEALRKPLTISKDGYVLDGHNRWARLRELDPEQKVVTNRVMLNARDALKLMHSFPKTFRKSVDQVGATKADYVSILKDSEAAKKAWLTRQRKLQEASAPKASMPSAINFTPALTLAEALKVAKDNGLPMVRGKADLVKDIMAYKDDQHSRMTPEEVQAVYGHKHDPSVKPSDRPDEVKNSKWLASEYSKYELKFEGKDPFDVSDAKKLSVQNNMNLNETLPGFVHAQKKFGRAPVYPANFGRRTGLMQGAGGQYEFGKVFLNTEWVSDTPNAKADQDSKNPRGTVTPDDPGGATFIQNGMAGTLRHEYGHHVHSSQLPKPKVKEWDELHTQVSGLPSKQNHKDQHMGYDKDTPLKSISSYSQANSQESFAELFQLMSHPSFKREKYPKEVQPLIDFMEKEIFS